MARSTRSSARLSTNTVKTEPDAGQDASTAPRSAKPVSLSGTPVKRNTTRKRSTGPDTPRSAKRIKVEDDDTSGSSLLVKAEQVTDTKIESALKGETPSPSKEKSLQSKKWKAFAQYANTSPFPNFPHPTPEECRRAHKILINLHGRRVRPQEIKASTTRAGCGDSPSVLDALVRTILSQNTSDVNSTRAKRSMDAVYGGSDEWENIVDGGQQKLQEAIKCGGLSAVKSKVIISILQQVKEKYGVYSLDHLFSASNEEAMQELLSFQGVGPKTASCVLLFCLQRESFAVDTHVWRITGLLGWRPKDATRDETHSHLDIMIPDEEKYGLHILLVKHGKVCEECKAGGKNVGKCDLRKAFQKAKT